jgi:hypothetical protein
MSRPAVLWICVALLLVAQTPEVAIAQPPAEKPTGIATASELFELFGMDEDFFKVFVDGESWNETHDDPLARVLVRLAQVKPLDIARWTVRSFKSSDVANHPDTFSRQFLYLDGRVRRVTRIKASLEMQERYDLEKYYRCEILLKDQELPAIVFAANVPEQWKLDAQISESISALALFLKRGPEDKSRKRTLYFAADRVAWHPDTLLGENGMDYGLFDTVQHERAITDSERECFYQLLAAAGRAPAEAMTSSSDDAADATSRLVSLMAGPQTHEGELHSFRGVARRAVKIHVNDPGTIARFGFDHYFEVVVFVELDGYQTIAGKKVTNHPVVFCVRRLPADMPTGENIAELVRASGFMFKKWTYMTQLTGEKGIGLRVTSPLLIGKAAVWEQREQAQWRPDPMVGGLIIAALTCMGLVAWWYSRRERRIHDAVVARRHALSESAPLDNLEFNSMDAAADIDRD